MRERLVDVVWDSFWDPVLNCRVLGASETSVEMLLVQVFIKM